MEAFARTIIEMVKFLELSGDNIIAPDAAVQMIETVSAILQESTPGEQIALRAALAQERARKVKSGSTAIELAFLDNFMSNLGLE